VSGSTTPAAWPGAGTRAPCRTAPDGARRLPGARASSRRYPFLAGARAGRPPPPRNEHIVRRNRSEDTGRPLRLRGGVDARAARTALTISWRSTRTSCGGPTTSPTRASSRPWSAAGLTHSSHRETVVSRLAEGRRGETNGEASRGREEVTMTATTGCARPPPLSTRRVRPAPLASQQASDHGPRTIGINPAPAAL
jgi:hypothetical protein